MSKPCVHSAWQVLGNPDMNADFFLPIIPGLVDIDRRILERVRIEGLYMNFLGRQEAELRLFRADEELVLQPGLDYALIPGLNSEERQRLEAVRPRSIVRVDGIRRGSDD
jgi:tRNA uridine 5-carboxymethylaminomethyl modification enzyme